MRFYMLALVVLCAGCRYSKEDAAQQAADYIGGWSKPNEQAPSVSKQVSFFRSYLSDTKEPLSEALANADLGTRMWAAHVIGQIGPDARSMEPVLAERIQAETSRGARIYLYEALRGIGGASPETIQLLKNSREHPREPAEIPKGVDPRWLYSHADEVKEIDKTLGTLGERSKQETKQ